MTEPTDEQLDQQIADIEALLNTGVKRTVNDGTTTEFDLDHLRSRLAELKRQKRKQSRFSTIDLSDY